MKLETKLAAALCGLSLLGLTGCIAVSDEGDSASIAANTEAALRVCGGPGTVKEVTEDGYSCMSDHK